jgi:glutathione-regulated potassium-efflux system protein KefB
MAAEAHGIDLLPAVVLLSSAVVAAPLFQRLRLGAVLGYLAAGIVVGPSLLGVVADPELLLHIAELGVVLFLFLIGLEMRPSHLWALRRDIFGLGVAQVTLCAALLAGIGIVTGYPVASSIIAGAGFVLTSTAIVMRLLEERRELGQPAGQRVVAILLFEDLLIVPLLALVAFLAPVAPGNSAGGGFNAGAVAVGLLSVAALVIAGRFLLNPLFRVLANVGAREVMTAAALLVVLGAAYAMQLGGLSMAMGAFVAGVLLSESIYRHQLEAEIQPFRGILLGLFFLAVGMSLNIYVVLDSWRTVLFYLFAFMVTKACAIYAIARLSKAPHREASNRAVLMAQGGEFAFVLYSAALSAGIIDGSDHAILTAIVILSMVITPFAIALRHRLERRDIEERESDIPADLVPGALIIGFGRFGQIASQHLLARGHRISIIDTDIEMIEVAREFDFEVYYGDGTRLDILHAAGARQAALVMVCVDQAEVATRIVQILKAEFSNVPVLARAIDRVHERELIGAGADYQIRETFESAMAFGQAALERLGASPAEIATYASCIRDRDRERFRRELEGGRMAARGLFSGKAECAAIPLD